MTKINDLTTAQLQRILAIKEQIEGLQSQIDSIAAGGDEVPAPSTVEAPTPAKPKYRMTAAHKRKLIKALARARAIRWARIKGTAPAASDKPAKKKDRRSSPATRAKIAAAARARWAKAKAAGKKAL
jgi:hypothetical protein